MVQIRGKRYKTLEDALDGFETSKWDCVISVKNQIIATRIAEIERLKKTRIAFRVMQRKYPGSTFSIADEDHLAPSPMPLELEFAENECVVQPKNKIDPRPLIALITGIAFIGSLIYVTQHPEWLC